MPAIPTLLASPPVSPGTASLVVTPDHTAPFVGSGRIAVLATPVMINRIEAAALKAVEQARNPPAEPAALRAGPTLI
jgi:hypothetical protein